MNKRVTLDDASFASSDTAFVVAYPSLNVSELVRTKELFDGERPKIASGTRAPVIACNGELGARGRTTTRPSGTPRRWAPSRFAREARESTGSATSGSNRPRVLFRAYPGPWQVLRRRRADDSLEVVHTQETFPGVQAVALDILPKHP